MEKRTGRKIVIEGIVQGIGFRPFIYHLAKKYGLTGSVKNTTLGVEIIVYGPENNIGSFINEIFISKPSLAVIKNIHIENLVYKQIETFHIDSSIEKNECSIFILPDIATCDNCKKDFFHKKSRFYQYPFVNCTSCGPRFSIIKKFPYDRKNTTMNAFTLCEECLSEYENIDSRRYHAEPISCHACGPKYSLLDKNFLKMETRHIFFETVKLLKDGKILAVKGIGGYHLMLDAKNISAIKLLRERKKRDRKPFAILFKDLDTVEKYCYVSEEEKKILLSSASPIVLLRKRQPIVFDEKGYDEISGNSPYYGAMLPYTPIHYILTESIPVLICTSGNISGEPIVYKEEDLKKIDGIADYYLIHNRDIVRFVEDSVIKVLHLNNNSLPILFRKSRGYAPLPLFIKKRSKNVVIGMGSDLKASISILKDDVLFQSQFLGDLTDVESYDAYKQCFHDLQDIFQVSPEVFVYDLHPAYLSSSFAKDVSKKGKSLLVQHHKAHIASVALEKGWIDDTILGIALDGTGYGEDGMIWGGEVFLGSITKGFKRVGSLSNMPLPFGDKAVKDPEKTAFAYLVSSGFDDNAITNIFSEEILKNRRFLKNYVIGSNILTSSTGRLFDAVSFLLGFKDKVSYEGEAAIELENLIYKISDGKDFAEPYEINIKNIGERYTIDCKALLKDIYKDFIIGTDKSEISMRFHSSIVEAFCKILTEISSHYKIKKVALSGGSFQNQYLLRHFFTKLEHLGFHVAINLFSPPNDACISIGQCAIGAFLN